MGEPSLAVCPYRTSKQVATQKYELQPPQRFEIRETRYEEPSTFTGTNDSDVNSTQQYEYENHQVVPENSIELKNDNEGQELANGGGDAKDDADSGHPNASEASISRPVTTGNAEDGGVSSVPPAAPDPPIQDDDVQEQTLKIISNEVPGPTDDAIRSTSPNSVHFADEIESAPPAFELKSILKNSKQSKRDAKRDKKQDKKARQLEKEPESEIIAEVEKVEDDLPKPTKKGKESKKDKKQDKTSKSVEKEPESGKPTLITQVEDDSVKSGKKGKKGKKADKSWEPEPVVEKKVKQENPEKQENAESEKPIVIEQVDDDSPKSGKKGKKGKKADKSWEPEHVAEKEVRQEKPEKQEKGGKGKKDKKGGKGKEKAGKALAGVAVVGAAATIISEMTPPPSDGSPSDSLDEVVSSPVDDSPPASDPAPSNESPSDSPGEGVPSPPMVDSAPVADEQTSDVAPASEEPIVETKDISDKTESPSEPLPSPDEPSSEASMIELPAPVEVAIEPVVEEAQAPAPSPEASGPEPSIEEASTLAIEGETQSPIVDEVSVPLVEEVPAPITEELPIVEDTPTPVEEPIPVIEEKKALVEEQSKPASPAEDTPPPSEEEPSVEAPKKVSDSTVEEPTPEVLNEDKLVVEDTSTPIGENVPASDPVPEEPSPAVEEETPAAIEVIEEDVSSLADGDSSAADPEQAPLDELPASEETDLSAATDPNPTVGNPEAPIDVDHSPVETESVHEPAIENLDPVEEGPPSAAAEEPATVSESTDDAITEDSKVSEDRSPPEAVATTEPAPSCEEHKEAPALAVEESASEPLVAEPDIEEKVDTPVPFLDSDPKDDENPLSAPEAVEQNVESRDDDVPLPSSNDEQKSYEDPQSASDAVEQDIEKKEEIFLSSSEDQPHDDDTAPVDSEAVEKDVEEKDDIPLPHLDNEQKDDNGSQSTFKELPVEESSTTAEVEELDASPVETEGLVNHEELVTASVESEEVSNSTSSDQVEVTPAVQTTDISEVPDDKLDATPIPEAKILDDLSKAGLCIDSETIVESHGSVSEPALEDPAEEAPVELAEETSKPDEDETPVAIEDEPVPAEPVIEVANETPGSSEEQPVLKVEEPSEPFEPSSEEPESSSTEGDQPSAENLDEVSKGLEPILEISSEQAVEETSNSAGDEQEDDVPLTSAGEEQEDALASSLVGGEVKNEDGTQSTSEALPIEADEIVHETETVDASPAEIESTIDHEQDPTSNCSTNIEANEGVYDTALQTTDEPADSKDEPDSASGTKSQSEQEASKFVETESTDLIAGSTPVDIPILESASAEKDEASDLSSETPTSSEEVVVISSPDDAIQAVIVEASEEKAEKIVSSDEEPAPVADSIIKEIPVLDTPTTIDQTKDDPQTISEVPASVKENEEEASPVDKLPASIQEDEPEASPVDKLPASVQEDEPEAPPVVVPSEKEVSDIVQEIPAASDEAIATPILSQAITEGDKNAELPVPEPSATGLKKEEICPEPSESTVEAIQDDPTPSDPLVEDAKSDENESDNVVDLKEELIVDETQEPEPQPTEVAIEQLEEVVPDIAAVGDSESADPPPSTVLDDLSEPKASAVEAGSQPAVEEETKEVEESVEIISKPETAEVEAESQPVVEEQTKEVEGSVEIISEPVVEAESQTVSEKEVKEDGESVEIVSEPKAIDVEAESQPAVAEETKEVEESVEIISEPVAAEVEAESQSAVEDETKGVEESVGIVSAPVVEAIESGSVAEVTKELEPEPLAETASDHVEENKELDTIPAESQEVEPTLELVTDDTVGVEEASQENEPVVEIQAPTDTPEDQVPEAIVEEVKEAEPKNEDPLPQDGDESKEIVEGPGNDSKENSALDDVVPIVVGAAAAVSAAVIVAEILSDNKPMTDKAIVEEPEQLPQVAEEPGPGESPSSPKSNKERHRYRSSRHSRSSHHSSSSKDVPREDRPRHHHSSSSRDIPREERPHHKRRETEPPPITSPKSSPRSVKPTRHDSGVSTGSTSSPRHRKDRTPEEQAAHEKRKEEKRTRLREAEAELSKSKPLDSAVLEEEEGTPMPAIPRRMSSSRRYSSGKSATSNGSTADGNKLPIFSALRGISIVKNPFVATDKSHVKEVVEKTKAPIIDRPRFSMDHERPKLSRRETTGHHTRTHRREREEDDKSEEERKARKSRRESEKAMATARAAVAEEARKHQEKEDEERRQRREERRARKAEAEALGKTSEVSGKISERSGGKGKEPEMIRNGEAVRSKERVHRHRHRREKEKEREEKPKGALKGLFSSMKKVFN